MPFQFDWSKVFEGFQSAPERLIGELGPWVRSLVMAATVKWLPRLTFAQDHCSVPHRPGSPRPCGAVAVNLCLACGRPACIWHAAMDAHGEVACYVCLGEKIAEKRGGPARPPPERPEPAVIDDRLVAAYDALGLSPDADDQELAAAYKEMLRKWHPDRYQSAAKKEIAELRFKAVRAAYDLIQKQRGTQAA